MHHTLEPETQNPSEVETSASCCTCRKLPSHYTNDRDELKFIINNFKNEKEPQLGKNLPGAAVMLSLAKLLIVKH